MKKTLTFLVATTLLATLSACDEVNMGNLFYSPCNVDKRFEQSMAYNQAHPIDTIRVANQDYAFWICSDLHIENEPHTYVSQFLAQATPQEAIFAVFNGDLYNGNEAYAEVAWQTIKAQSQIPYFCVAGNHDLYFGWDVYGKRFGTSTYTVVVKTPEYKDLYLFLESAGATMGKSQLQWITNQLGKRKQYRHCFVVTHNNFFPEYITNGVFMQDETHKLFGLFGDNKVTAVFSGHAHVTSDNTVLGVRYLTTGDLQNGHYGVVQVTPEGFEWTCKQF